MRRKPKVGWRGVAVILLLAGCANDETAQSDTSDVGQAEVAADAGSDGMAGTDSRIQFDTAVDAPTDAASETTPDAPLDTGDDAPEDGGSDSVTDLQTDDASDAIVDSKPDAPIDTQPDVTVDVLPDIAVDAEPDATIDVPPDIAVDAEPDATVDVPPEVALDAGADAEPDATVDVPPDVAADADAEPDSSSDAMADALTDSGTDIQPDDMADTIPDSAGDVDTDVCSDGPCACFTTTPVASGTAGIAQTTFFNAVSATGSTITFSSLSNGPDGSVTIGGGAMASGSFSATAEGYLTEVQTNGNQLTFVDRDGQSGSLTFSGALLTGGGIAPPISIPGGSLPGMIQLAEGVGNTIRFTDSMGVLFAVVTMTGVEVCP